MTYLLILVIMYGNHMNSLTVEFNNKENCKNAIKALEEERSYGQNNHVVCVKK